MQRVGWVIRRCRCAVIRGCRRAAVLPTRFQESHIRVAAGRGTALILMDRDRAGGESSRSWPRPIPRCRARPSGQPRPGVCRPWCGVAILPRRESFASPQSLLIVLSARQPWPTSSIPLAGSASQVGRRLAPTCLLIRFTLRPSAGSRRRPLRRSARRAPRPATSLRE
jgi:hypothetical protein